MNYLWEAMIQARNQGIPEENLHFCVPKVFSAYMEISNNYMNQNSLETGQVININPYYRFFEIFKDLYQPDYHQGSELRASLTNLILHQLAGNDVLSGMTREEYYKNLLLQDIKLGRSGALVKEAISLFDIDEQQIILSGMLRQYQTGCSVDIFREMMEALIPENIVYHNNKAPSEILVYISQKREEKLEKKLRFLISGFLDMAGNVDIYYKYHFGIIGVEETMVMDEIALC
ncbi:hypothetical protein [Lacrimispora brassicae]